MNYKIISASLSSLLCISQPAISDVIEATFDGYLTIVDSSGNFIPNIDAIGGPYGGFRTPISGTIRFDSDTLEGSGNFEPFPFLGGGEISSTSISFAAIGDGQGGEGNLVLGSMLFNWGGFNDIPVSVVMDSTGWFNVVQAGIAQGQTVTGGVLSATDNTVTPFGNTLPIGEGLMMTTTYNTSNGGLPLVEDLAVDATNGDIGIGGSPITALPFIGMNANFDVTSVTVTNIIPSSTDCMEITSVKGDWVAASTTPGPGDEGRGTVVYTFEDGTTRTGVVRVNVSTYQKVNDDGVSLGGLITGHHIFYDRQPGKRKYFGRHGERDSFTWLVDTTLTPTAQPGVFQVEGANTLIDATGRYRGAYYGKGSDSGTLSLNTGEVTLNGIGMVCGLDADEGGAVHH